MPLLHIIILALIQGITEFLPVSSSGHLVLAQNLMNDTKHAKWADHMMLDTAVHVGTLFSVLLYFRKDVFKMLVGLKDAITGQTDNEGTRLILYIVAGSIPVITAGLALKILQPSWLLATEIIAWTTLIFGIVLWIADAKGPTEKELKDLTIKDAILIGLAQMLALIPGVSRSGITMTAGRFLGYTRHECAHYALLLGIIAISGAGVLGGLSVIEKGNAAITTDLLIAVVLSFATGWISIALMMKWLEHASFKIFAIYRIILGGALLLFVYHEALSALIS